MKTFSFTAASPDGNVFKGDAARVIVRGTEGDLAVLAGHIPFVTGVKPGVCRILLPDGTEKKGRTEGGILTVDTESATLLSGRFRIEEE